MQEQTQSTLEQQVFDIVMESVIKEVLAPATQGLINESEGGEEENFEKRLIESVTEYVYETTADIVIGLLPNVLESIQNAQTEEEVSAAINNTVALAEMYAAGVLEGLQPLIYEYRIPEKIKKVLKYLGLGALGAGALAGAAYAGAHADQIGQQVSHAKDVVQQKLQSLIQHLRGGAEQVAQHTQHATAK